jgi:hypothetical protein
MERATDLLITSVGLADKSFLLGSLFWFARKTILYSLGVFSFVTLTALSFEARLGRKLSAWRMSLDSFSSLVSLSGIRGASKTRTAAALNGKPFPVEIAIALETLVGQIDALMAAVAPLKLDVSAPVELFELLTAFHAGLLDIRITKKQ